MRYGFGAVSLAQTQKKREGSYDVTDIAILELLFWLFSKYVLCIYMLVGLLWYEPLSTLCGRHRNGGR